MEPQSLVSLIFPILAQSATTLKDVVDVRVINTQRDWTTCIAFLALLTSVVAISVSFWEGYQNRRHNRLCVRPHLRFERITAEDGIWGMFLMNSGLGPAIIKRIFLTIDGKEYPIHEPEDWKKVNNLIAEMLVQMEKDIGPTVKLTHFITVPSHQNIQIDTCIANGERLKIFCANASSLNDDEKVLFKVLLGRIASQADYESMYGESFTAT